jgi:competence ComEA-like helix-hairpin-helix protein
VKNSPQHTGQTSAMHGLIVIAVVAILITVAGTGKQFIQDAMEVVTPHPRCAYLVFQAEQCMGTVFSDSPISVAEILARLSIRSGSLSIAPDKVPCFSCLNIASESKKLQIKPMKGSQILCYGKRMDLNSATASDLTVIPGIGPKLADRIIKFRESSGGFRDIGELRKIRGLHVKKVASAAEFVEIHAPGKNLSAVVRPVRTWSAISSSPY